MCILQFMKLERNMTRSCENCSNQWMEICILLQILSKPPHKHPWRQGAGLLWECIYNGGPTNSELNLWGDPKSGRLRKQTQIEFCFTFYQLNKLINVGHVS